MAHAQLQIKKHVFIANGPFACAAKGRTAKNGTVSTLAEPIEARNITIEANDPSAYSAIFFRSVFEFIKKCYWQSKRYSASFLQSCA